VTKEQKTTEVTDLIQTLRQHYTLAEFSAMALAIWNALDAAAAAAVQNP
jgi:hypothetical protein